MTDIFLLVKWLHIMSATVLFGTGLGTAFHMYVTYRRGNVRAIAAMTRNTVLADWLFTAPAGVIQPISGVALAQLTGFPLNSSWLVVTYFIYVVAGLCWLKVVALQYHMRALAVEARRTGQPLTADFHRAMRTWFILGWPAFIGLTVVFALMVLKPELW